MVKKLLLLISFWSVIITGFSQIEDKCSLALNKATEEFEHGHFYQIKSILEGCLKRGFTREQETQAHYILTRTYLFLDKPDSAEYHFLKFLKLNPLFEVDEENDPIDIVYLSDKFTTTPIYTLSFKTGISLTKPLLVHDGYSIGDPDYKVGLGFHFPAGVEVHLGDFITVGTHPSFTFKKWRYHEGYFTGSYYNDKDQLAYSSDTVEMKETNILLDIPLFVKYTFDGNPFRPFVYGGYSANLLFYSRQNFDYSDVNGPLLYPVDGEPADNIQSRRFIDHSLLLGGGVMYQIGKYYLSADLQFNIGLKFMNDPENRYPMVNEHYNSNPNFRWAYIDNDFRINTVKLNLAFIKPLYKPRKKDQNTIRDLLDNLRLEEEE